MTIQEIVGNLKALGSESIKKILLKHGAVEPFLGVKVEELKKIQKKIKYNHKLAVELYDTGISDAMYLAGLIAEPEKMSKNELEQWAEKASWNLISEYTVAWVASESAFAWEIGLEWINRVDPKIASTGWATMASYVSITQNEKLDISELQKLLKRVEKDIHDSPNRVKYTMNNFLIGVGSYVKELHESAIETAKRIGSVTVFMGETSCKVPFASDYITKTTARGTLEKKRKEARC